MAGLILWKNQEINKLKRDMDRLFDRMWDDFGMPLSTKVEREIPSIDLSETEDSLIIKAEVPGINPEDMEISITDNILTIKGEMTQEDIEEKGDYHRMERRYGYFSRTLELPCKIVVEDVRATYKKGVLSIVMPKCEQPSTREIRIKVK
jgi:HSP20 family protein